MNRLEFSFGNAVGHFQKTGGPKGFLWKFALTYALFAIIVQGLSLYLMAPIYAAAFNPIVMEDPDVMDQVMLENMGRVLLGYLVSFVFGILMWVLFEAASQRRYMRAEGFGLKFGAGSRGVVPHVAVSSRPLVRSAVSAGTSQYETPASATNIENSSMMGRLDRCLF